MLVSSKTNSACNCCNVPPDLGVNIQTKISQTFVTKCGFSKKFSAIPQRIYRQKTIVQEGEYTRDDACGIPDTGLSSGTYYTEIVARNVRDPDDYNFRYGSDARSCIADWDGVIVSRTGTVTRTRECEGAMAYCEASLNNDGTWSGTSTLNGVDTEINFPCETWGSGDRTLTTTVTYQDEFTTGQLIERGEGFFTEYSEEWSNGSGQTIEIYRELIKNEDIFVERRIKWRMIHAPTASCYLKVWLSVVSKDSPNSEETVEELEPYVWNGTGNPCFNDPTKLFSHEDNLIIGKENDFRFSEEEEITGSGILSPQFHPRKFIKIEKYSYLPDYEPDPENGKQNGWPIQSN